MTRRAAQYLRMSSDRQELSIAVQKAAIEDYARTQGVALVATYEDAARSGLRIANRPAMRQLMADVANEHCPFDVVLVYDISRWGRFQNTDASAYYDYHCRLHGVEVVYVAEAFGTDASPFGALIKNLKRAMAAEYSRELGVKVRAGMQRLVQRGFKMGGVPSLGLARQVVAQDGSPKMLLGRYERKALQTDHVKLVPGPPDEVALLQRIFREYATTDISMAGLAHALANEGVLRPDGRPFTADTVRTLLKSEHFTGNYVWGRHRVLHDGARVRVPRSQQVRLDASVTPLVDEALWRAVQDKLQRRRGQQRTREQLIDQLGAALRAAPGMGCSQLPGHGCANAQTYVRYFGSYAAAKALALRQAGQPGSEAAESPKGERFRRSHALGRQFQADLAQLLREAGAHVTYGPKQCALRVDDAVIQIQLAWRRGHTRADAWYVQRLAKRAWDFLLVMRMNDDGTGRDFFLLQHGSDPLLPTYIGEYTAPHVEAMRLDNSDELCAQLLARCSRWLTAASSR